MSDSIKIAGELLSAAKQILAANYVYDPDHRNKPKGGGWHKTDKGWSNIPKTKLAPIDFGENEKNKAKGEAPAKKSRFSDVPGRYEMCKELDNSPICDFIVSGGEGTLSDEQLKYIEDVIDWYHERDDAGIDVDSRTKGEGDTMELLEASLGGIENPTEKISDFTDEMQRKWELAEEIDLMDDSDKLETAMDADTPRNVLRLLVDDENKKVSSAAKKSLSETGDASDARKKHMAATSMRTPEKMLRELALDESSRVRSAVAGNLKTPRDVLDMLAGDENKDVRCSVAENPNSELETIQRLARDKNKTVREKAATHKNVSVDMLINFAHDRDSILRGAAADNQNTPSDILDQLAGDKDNHVRFGVARNPSSSPETLDRLAQDPVSNSALKPSDEWYVRSSKLDHIEYYKQEILHSIANNYKASDEVLGHVLDNIPSEEEGRNNEHHNTWTDYLTKQSVCWNPKASKDTLMRLCKDGFVLDAIKNRNADRDVWDYFLKHGEENYMPNELAKVRNIPEYVLRDLAKRKNKEVREYARMCLQSMDMLNK